MYRGVGCTAGVLAPKLHQSSLLQSLCLYLTVWLPAPQIDFMAEPDARCLFQQLIVAVDYCHKLGIANRDIKVCFQPAPGISHRTDLALLVTILAVISIAPGSVTDTAPMAACV